MTWMATSPYGPVLNSSWTCTDAECPAGSHGDPLGSDGGRLRAEAGAHLEETGHRVRIVRGTVEHLYPMATAVVPEGGSGE
jgi:hypothetical protein